MSYELLRTAYQAISVSVLYGVTLILLWQGVLPFIPVKVKKEVPTVNSIYVPVEPAPVFIKPVLSGQASQLNIPNLRFSKEILPGEYNDISKTWNVSPRGIHFALPSQEPNDTAGNTLIYGHNNKYVFGPLTKLKKGDIATLVTDNDYLFTYRFEYSKPVDPTDTSIFSYNGPPLLTLQTCSGPLNEVRDFYIFTLISTEKI